MINENQTKLDIISSLDFFYELAREQFPNLNLSKPNLSFDVKGAAAGLAYWKKNLIKINLQCACLNSENLAHILNNTVPHELSHLIARNLHSSYIKPHGSEWRSIMRKLGVEPSRTHSMDVVKAKRTVRRHIYACPCRKHNVSTIVHNRILRGYHYSCAVCKKPITRNQ
jgi:SprT protein